MILIYSTFPSSEEAERISRVLVEKKLVACANIMAGHRSLYWWEGQVEEADEVAVLYKTRPELFEQVQEVIVEHHSYDVPCVVSFDIQDGHGAFLKWISDVTVF